MPAMPGLLARLVGLLRRDVPVAAAVPTVTAPAETAAPPPPALLTYYLGLSGEVDREPTRGYHNETPSGPAPRHPELTIPRNPLP